MANESTREPTRQILIVDDSPMSLKLLTHMISMQGYRTESVTSSTEALASALASPPDLVLLDIMMPEMDGFEVAQKLKADARTADVPIIFISALSDEKSKVKAFTAGGVDYVSKPLHVNEVLARVGTHLRLRSTTRRLQQELTERETLIAELDAVNDQLKSEIEERESAQAQLSSVLARTQALYRITRSLITSEGIPDMLATATESVVQALSADRVMTVVLDTETEDVTLWATSGPGASSLRKPVFDDLMEGLEGWVVKRVQPVISLNGLPDPRESGAARRRRREDKCGAIVVAPLTYLGTMMGTVTAINRPDQGDFEGEQLAQLTAIAGQISIALANARLSDETAYLKEFNEGIVQGVAEAILILDDEQRVTFANRAAVALLGYDVDDLVGQPSSVVFPEDAALYAAARMPVPESGTPARFETTVVRLDGQRIPVLCGIRPLFQGGELTGSLAALTDITAIKEAEKQLRQYATDLEARNSELDAFAHTVAHDLRSPLTGLIGFVDLLQVSAGDRGDEEYVEYAHYLYRNSVKMNNIIDELLLLASVREVDDIDVDLLNMPRIVKDAYDRLDYMIDEYGAEVSTAASWPQALGYGPWVEEVWVNYLSNAVKYGGDPDGGKPPRIELGHDDACAEGFVRFWVRDNGNGLTTKQRKQLFTPFERLHNVRAEGHGLGLSIVRRILEKLGGEVGVESTPGEGSTFYFTLPVA